MAELSTPHVTKGMDHVAQGVATAAPLGDVCYSLWDGPLMLLEEARGEERKVQGEDG